MKKHMRKISKREKGFTLLEVIVTITIIAILASILVTFMGTAVTKSSDPVNNVRDLSASSGSMEKLSAAYACYLSACSNNDVCCSGCLCTWEKFKTACAAYGSVADVTISGETFDIVQVSANTGNQKIVSYFME